MRRGLLLLAIAVAGCSSEKPPEPVDTGSREAVTAFHTAATSGDAARAYGLLDEASRRRVSAEQFAALARNYAKQVGFAAEHVQFHAWEEVGDRATAHVVLVGRTPGHARRYQDALTLRREHDRWAIVLPANFGRAK